MNRIKSRTTKEKRTIKSMKSLPNELKILFQGTPDRNHHSHKSGGEACNSGKDGTSGENKMAAMWETVNKLGKDTYNVADNESRSEKKDASKKPHIVDLCEEDQKKIIHLLEESAKFKPGTSGMMVALRHKYPMTRCSNLRGPENEQRDPSE
uniref:(California timema) hypothetical protein n=1 Tax=Timema californicum TaxID=61474 RepID=A0A7R9JLJ6_TIMCA|nr:unnamed protein product [Timema californicum]